MNTKTLSYLQAKVGESQRTLKEISSRKKALASLMKCEKVIGIIFTTSETPSGKAEIIYNKDTPFPTRISTEIQTKAIEMLKLQIEELEAKFKWL